MYNSYFGFRESPFSVTPDPRFFYTNPVYLEAYAALRYGIEAKKGFVIISGEVGTGKTTLLRRLLHNLENSVRSVFIFNTHLSFAELLQATLHDLGLTPKDASKVTMLQQLYDYLIEQLKQGHTVAALIDEAQNLSAEVLEELRLLSNLETDREKLLQIVLVGQPELEAKLDQPPLRQLKQRVAVRCRLDPLKDEEVGAYVDFRLRAAGYEGKSLFHRDAVEQMAFYSKGIPRLINIICDNALLIAYAESKKNVSPDMIKQVARDLRLESAIQMTQAETAPAVLESRTERQPPIREVLREASEHNLKPAVGVGIGTLLGILVFAGVAFVMTPQKSLNMTESVKAAKHNPNSRTVPKKPHVKAEFKQDVEFQQKEEHRVTIQYGDTIYQMAADAYGPNTFLGMDLIKELNPQIENLNWVFAGEDLLLPSLARETLLRQQSDGSYHLIAASFISQTGA
ncbi:MAG TPA: AAA family ATPase, partial [Candidatus Binatia bacterium]|nr:AAA family ATPase [Candidatus Binatia bacterium]